MQQISFKETNKIDISKLYHFQEEDTNNYIKIPTKPCRNRNFLVKLCFWEQASASKKLQLHKKYM